MTDTVEVTENDMTVAQAARTWVWAMPDEMLPDESEFARWLNSAGNDPALLFSAIKRASNKRKKLARAGVAMTTEAIGRYVTSVVHRENHGISNYRPPVNREHLDVTTSITERADGDRMTIHATDHARKFNKNGIRRLA
jgi:hypothetical protein